MAKIKLQIVPHEFTKNISTTVEAFKNDEQYLEDFFVKIKNAPPAVLTAIIGSFNMYVDKEGRYWLELWSTGFDAP